jgi:hypothetical protein
MKIHLKLQFVFILFQIITSSISAQESSRGVPLSLQWEMEGSIPIFSLPFIENEEESQRVKEISERSCNSCKNNYYGTGIEFPINIKTAGQLITVKNNINVWRLKIESATALGMQFYFSKYKIPIGGRLYFYNEDSLILGAFTNKNNSDNYNGPFAFGTEILMGKSIVIEYQEPVNPEFEAELEIKKVIHIFTNVFEKFGFFGGDGGCHTNVSCPLGDGWEKEISSVVVILIYDANNDLEGCCSGSVINNTAQDGRPLLLSANHCIDQNDPSGDCANWIFVFHHETSTCLSDGSDVSDYIGVGNSVRGSTLLVKDVPNSLGGSNTSDYLLLELNTSPTNLSTLGVCYSGWDKDVVQGSSSPYTIGIHHPMASVKKISKDDDSPISSDYHDPKTHAPSDSHWKVVWNTGVTEGGSSGSPLFNSDHRIIGQLHGGSSSCIDQSSPDFYGKMSEDWFYSGSGGFAFYLDPLNRGDTHVDTYCPGFVCGNGIVEPGEECDPPNYYCNSSCQIINGGGGGGFYCGNYYWQFETGDNCFSNLHYRGMLINGNAIGMVPAISTLPIRLDAINRCAPTCVGGALWEGDLYEESPGLFSSECNGDCHTGLIYCHCYFKNYYIELIETDNNLNWIGAPHGGWIREQTPWLSWAFDHIDVDQNIVNTINAPLINGKYYRIKLAFIHDGTWLESDRYFQYTGATIIPPLRCDGNDITVDHDGASLILYILEANLGAENTITVTAGNTPYPNVSIHNKTWSAGNMITINGEASITGESDLYINPCSNSSGPERLTSNSSTQSSSSHNKPNSMNTLASQETFGSIEVNSDLAIPFLISPNPNSGMFNILLPEPLQNSKIIIYDLLGNMIWQKNAFTETSITVDISNDPKGIYTIKVIKEGKIGISQFAHM